MLAGCEEPGWHVVTCEVSNIIDAIVSPAIRVALEITLRVLQDKARAANIRTLSNYNTDISITEFIEAFIDFVKTWGERLQRIERLLCDQEKHTGLLGVCDTTTQRMHLMHFVDLMMISFTSYTEGSEYAEAFREQWTQCYADLEALEAESLTADARARNAITYDELKEYLRRVTYSTYNTDVAHDAQLMTEIFEQHKTRFQEKHEILKRIHQSHLDDPKAAPNPKWSIIALITTTVNSAFDATTTFAYNATKLEVMKYKASIIKAVAPCVHNGLHKLMKRIDEDGTGWLKCEQILLKTELLTKECRAIQDDPLYATSLIQSAYFNRSHTMKSILDGINAITQSSTYSCDILFFCVKAVLTVFIDAIEDTVRAESDPRDVSAEELYLTQFAALCVGSQNTEQLDEYITIGNRLLKAIHEANESDMASSLSLTDTVPVQEFFTRKPSVAATHPSQIQPFHKLKMPWYLLNLGPPEQHQETPQQHTPSIHQTMRATSSDSTRSPEPERVIPRRHKPPQQPARRYQRHEASNLPQRPERPPRPPHHGISSLQQHAQEFKPSRTP